MKTSQANVRNISFFIFNTLVLIIFYIPLRELFTSSFSNALYSHIILIPLVSGYFILTERRAIFSSTGYAIAPGIVCIIISIVMYLIGLSLGSDFNENDYLSLMTFSAIVFWGGGFVLFYGTRVLRKASFPLLFLVFMIPVPSILIEKIIYALQSASTEVSYGFFKLIGVPLLRDGFVFYLPGISIEVAEQCSGIRSTLALFITSVIAGHLLLKTSWKKVILSLAVFPIAVVKNGARIVTLSMLASYVDERFITQSLLHSRGGIPFFILALALFVPLLWVLRRSDVKGT